MFWKICCHFKYHRCIYKNRMFFTPEPVTWFALVWEETQLSCWLTSYNKKCCKQLHTATSIIKLYNGPKKNTLLVFLIQCGKGGKRLSLRSTFSPGKKTTGLTRPINGNNFFLLKKREKIIENRNFYCIVFLYFFRKN